MTPINKLITHCFKIGDYVKFNFDSIEVIGVIRNINWKKNRATIQIPQNMVSVPIFLLKIEQDSSKFPQFPSIQIGDPVNFIYKRKNVLGYVRKINKTTISINSELGVIRASYSRVTPAPTNIRIELPQKILKCFLKEDNLKSNNESIKPLIDSQLQEIKPYVQKLVNGLLKKSDNLIKESSNSLIYSLNKFYNLPNLKVYTRGKRKFEGRRQAFGEHRIRGAGTAYERSSISVYSKEWKKNEYIQPESFIKTLIHEFMHHYDRCQLNLDNLLHTKGFEERVDLLYNQFLQFIAN